MLNKKTLISTIKYLSLSLLLVPVITWLVNLSVFDEKLEPEISRLISTHTMPADKDNAYIAIMGINAANDRDIFETGRALLDRYQTNRADLKYDGLKPSDYVEIEGKPESNNSWEEQYDNCNYRSETLCFESIQKQVKANPINDPRLILQLERYKKIIKLPNLVEIQEFTFGTPLPSFGTFLELERLHFANLAQNYSTNELIAAIGHSVKFWRMSLKQNKSLISRMIANAALNFNLQVISSSIKSGQLNERQKLTLSDLLSPLGRDELSISSSFGLEIGGYRDFLNNLDSKEDKSLFEVPNWLIKNFTQTNASLNMIYRYSYQPVLLAEELSSKDFAEQYQAKKFFNQYSISLSPTSLYNLGGKVLYESFTADYTDYLARLHDLNAMIAMTRLQIKLSNVDDSSRDKIVNSTINPISGKTFILDTSNQALSFDCLEKRAKCEISLKQP